MTSKVGQLFLELSLLRLRYSAEEIQQVARLREVAADPYLSSIVRTLQEIEAILPAKKPREKTVSKSASTRTAGYRTDPRRAISLFLERIAHGRILAKSDDLRNFARSIGASSEIYNKEDLIDSIRERLKNMPTAQAVQKISNISKQSNGDSSPYVDLAKTLMRK